MSVRVHSARNRRINSGLHLERPLVRIAGLGTELKPRRRAIASARQRDKFYGRTVKVLVDPVRVAVEILDRVQRRAQGDQDERLARALVGIWLLAVSRQRALRVL